MNVRINRRIEMGVRALEFCHAHQFQDPGYNSSVKQLEDQVAHAKLLASEQERGIKEVHAATSRKSTLSRTIRRSHLVHLATIAQRAAKELPELEAKFDISGLPRRQLPFRTVARSLLEQAEQHKELLVKHGLIEEVLVSLRRSLDELDQVVDRGAEGRRIHIGARANLEAAGAEVTQIVRGLDGFFTFRFGNQPDLLAAWISASNVFGPPVSAEQTDGRTGGPVTPPATPAPGGDIKPAA
jgi:hypothetical protein